MPGKNGPIRWRRLACIEDVRVYANATERRIDTAGELSLLLNTGAPIGHPSGVCGPFTGTREMIAEVYWDPSPVVHDSTKFVDPQKPELGQDGVVIPKAKALARHAVNRVLQAVRGTTRQPGVRLLTLNEWEDGSVALALSDEKGNRLPFKSFELRRVGDNVRYVGAVTDRNASDVAEFAEGGAQTTIPNEVRLDACRAFLAEDYRVSTFFFALACETLAKGVAYGVLGKSGAEKLVDSCRRAHGNSRVLPYFDEIALASIGRSFRSDHGEKWDDLRNLFRARNSIAHRGDLVFRQVQDGTDVTVDSLRTEGFLHLADLVFDWFSAPPSPVSTPP